MTGIIILIALTVAMALAGHWAGQDGQPDADTLRIYLEGNLARRDRARQMELDTDKARAKGRR
jgi:hypothetical protein